MELIICCEEMFNLYGDIFWFDAWKVGEKRTIYFHVEDMSGVDEINYCPFCGAKTKVTLKKAKKN